MNIWYIKIRIKYYNAIIYVFGILFVFLSGCRYHQTRTSVNDVKSNSHHNKNSEIKDSIINKSDTLNKNSKQKTDSIAPSYNIRMDEQPLYGIKMNVR